MIRLRAVRLVQWYHFVDQTFDFSGNVLLLGDNGSGKSTVLDAIQFALVADESQVRFNKAANEHSRRTLYSYVRHKLGSEDAERPGQIRFGRGACTSYIILEFAEHRDPTTRFCAGVVLEASEAESTRPSRWHFVVPGASSAEVPAVGPGDVVRTLRDFRAALRDLGVHPWPDAGTYREELRHRLGPIPESFHRLIVKALDFKPIGQVRDFVFHYLLDERPVDTASLQANLEHYKRLEAQARDAERRIADLDAICEQGERIVQERRTAESHLHLARRADVELAEDKLRGLGEERDNVSRAQMEVESDLERCDERRDFFDRERDRLSGLLAGNPTYQQVQTLNRDLEETQREIKEAQAAETQARGKLQAQLDILELLVSSQARDLRRARPALFSNETLLGDGDPPAVVAKLRENLYRDGALKGRDLATWSRRLEKTGDDLRLALLRLEEELTRAKSEGAALQDERDGLAKGRQRYPEGAEALLHLLKTRLKGASEPRALCELIEVANARWRDAVEGFLNTRRFDVIVAPQDFPRALSLYERHKRSYALPGRGEVFISKVGLVDIERIQASRTRVERGSLAEQIDTDEPLARAYVDHLLGDVICVDDEQSLRHHRRAITDTVMVYQGFVARQTGPEVFARHFIGQAARIRRMDEIDRRLGELSLSIVAMAGDVEWLKAAGKRIGAARNDAIELPRLVEEAQRAPELIEQLRLLKRQLDGINRDEIAGLQGELEDVKGRLSHVAEERDRLKKRAGQCEEALVRLGSALEEASTAHASALVELAATTDDEDRRTVHEHRYAKERSSRSAAEVRRIFEQQHRNIASRVSNLVTELVSLKTSYAQTHGFVGEVLGEDWKEFAVERDAWQESRLPEYHARIARAKQEAIEQLAEDIIFRLRENLLDVTRQIKELNRALKDVPFGNDYYQFVWEAAPEHKAFYDLIMEAGRFEKDSLFGNAALSSDATKQTLTGLFDRLIAGEAREVKTELEAKADYREYFTYDLKILHADGNYSLYDRVAGDKSGGETQTPYYIAIFASMYRLYRSLSSEGRATCGLVLLDEAFSKMDEPRIAATLRFARELGLQLVMAAPKERSELVAPSVETSLYIHKDPISGAPSVYDFTKEFAEDAKPEADSAPGDPVAAARGVRA